MMREARAGRFARRLLPQIWGERQSDQARAGIAEDFSAFRALPSGIEPLFQP
jgi:hypothetical protein